MPTNVGDGSTILEAGAQKPIIKKLNYGNLDTSSLSAVNIPLVVSTISPTSGNLRGGLTITLSNKSFLYNYSFS